MAHKIGGGQTGRYVKGYVSEITKVKLPLNFVANL